ncbi:MAG TPA: pitrilysin family protein [Bacteroidota bacterium]|nr:pitrilysin family protein [Bacteroidota bacterium]
MSMHNGNDPKLPPTPGIPKDVTFPDYHELVLGNGLRVLVHAQRTLPLVNMNLVLRGGSSHDSALAGLASMTGEMLIKGTPGRSAQDIVEAIEGRGGSIGSGAGWDSISIGITHLSRHTAHAMDVLADVARQPAFQEEELQRMREQRLADILQEKSSPGVLAWQRFCAALYGAHPYGLPQDGDEHSVEHMTVSDLRRVHAERFHPGNAFLLVVGDADPDEVLRLAEQQFGDWPIRDAAMDGETIPAAAEERVVQIVDRPNAVQTSVVVGHGGISRTSEDYIAVSVMNTLFGGYFGSRLNLNLREDKGYTYGAHSRFDARRHAGPFAAGAEVRSEITDLAIEEMLREMHRLREEPVSPEELEHVQRYVTGSFPLQIETPTQVAQRIIAIELYGLGKTWYNRFNSSVMALTPERIQETAQRYLHPDTAAIVVSGRGQQLRNTLERFGAVQVYDTDGAIIPDVSPLAQDL